MPTNIFSLLKNHLILLLHSLIHPFIYFLVHFLACFCATQCYCDGLNMTCFTKFMDQMIGAPNREQWFTYKGPELINGLVPWWAYNIMTLLKVGSRDLVGGSNSEGHHICVHHVPSPSLSFSLPPAHYEVSNPASLLSLHHDVLYHRTVAIGTREYGMKTLKMWGFLLDI